MVLMGIFVPSYLQSLGLGTVYAPVDSFSSQLLQLSFQLLPQNLEKGLGLCPAAHISRILFKI